MHQIKATKAPRGGDPSLFVEIAGQRQLIPPLVQAKPGDYLVIMTAEQAQQWRCNICGGLVRYDGTAPGECS